MPESSQLRKADRLWDSPTQRDLFLVKWRRTHWESRQPARTRRRAPFGLTLAQALTTPHPSCCKRFLSVHQALSLAVSLARLSRAWPRTWC